MDRFGGMGAVFLFFQLFNLTILLAWIVLSISALFFLRKCRLPATPRALWALIILVVPLFGAIAFWIVRPAEDEIAD